MAQPVSWFVIERGWRVVDADGAELGQVSAVIGDEDADIFDGLHVKTPAAGERYVPGDRVGPIEEGRVTVAARLDDLESTPAAGEPGGMEVSPNPEADL